MKIIQKNLHYYYLFTSAIYIFFYIFITPPFYTNDEYSHFQKAASKENIYLNGPLYISDDALEFADLFNHIQIRTYWPEDDIENYKNYDYFYKIKKKKSKIYLDDFVKSENKDFNYSKKFYSEIFPEYNWDKIWTTAPSFLSRNHSQAQLSNLVGYPMTGYLFSKIGIKISKIFSNKVYISFYFGRIFNAIFCIGVVFFTLKFINRGKEFIFALFSLPTVLKLSASFSQDGILFSISLLAILIFGTLDDKKIIKTQVFNLLIFVMIFLFFLVSLSRPTYILFFSLPLIFFFKDIQYNRKIFIISLLFIFSVLFLLFIKYYPIPIEPLQFEDGSTNIDFLINNIGLIPKILINDYVNNFQKYITMFIAYMGHGNFYIHYRLVELIGLSFAFITLCNFNFQKFFTIKNLYIIMVCLGSIIVIQIMQYIYSTDPGRLDVIQGIDSRYFVPMAIIFSLLLKKNDYLLNKYLDKIKNFTVLMIPHLNIFVLIHLKNYFTLQPHWLIP